MKDMKIRSRIIAATILGLAIWFVGMQIQKNANTGELKGISVLWEGKSSMTPDTLTINISISELAKTTELAQQQSDEKLSKVQEILKSFNIDKKDIQTTNASINPEYDRSKSERTLLGYRSNQTLKVTLSGEGFEQKGADFTASISKIGNVSVDNTTFSLKDPNNAANEAREKAFADAQSKAEQLAKLAGVKLGKVIYVSEQINQSYPTPMYYAKAEMAADSAAGTTALSAGSSEVSMSVNVSYEIK